MDIDCLGATETTESETVGKGDYYRSFDIAMCMYYGSNSAKGLSPTGVRESFPEKPLEVRIPGCGWVLL